MTGWDPTTDAWLSGFADGEASFGLNLKRQLAPATGVYAVVGVQPVMTGARAAQLGTMRESLISGRRYAAA